MDDQTDRDRSAAVSTDDPDDRRRTSDVGTSPARDAVGVVFPAVGAALVVHIALLVSLALALSAAAGLVVVAMAARYAFAADRTRSLIRRRTTVGLLAGVVATTAYDAVRGVIVALDLVTVNPFEAIPVFGQLLLPSGTGTGQLVAGISYHVVNGVFFGVAFALLVARPSWRKGVLWGVGLEAVQLTLYPDWLDITRFSEFAQVSVVAHVVYGGVLGTACDRLLERRATAVEAPTRGG